MFKNKRKYQKDQIEKWINKGMQISKTKLAKKINISRVTLNKFLDYVHWEEIMLIID